MFIGNKNTYIVIEYLTTTAMLYQANKKASAEHHMYII